MGGVDGVGRSAKARGRAGLQCALGLGVHATRLQVGVVQRCFGAEHGRKARICAFQQGLPVGLGVLQKQRRQAGAALGPGAAVPLVAGEVWVALQAQPLQQQLVELRLNRPNDDVLPIRADIGVVERCHGVQAGAARVAHQAGAAHAEHEVEHVRRAIDDGRIHHRALAAGARLQHASQQPRHQIERTAANVPQHAHGGDGAGIGRAAAPHGPGQGGVVGIVPRGVCQRAVLAPAGHAAIDQGGIDGVALLRAQAQALHAAGAHAFDEDVGLGHQLQHQGAALGGFEVGKDRALAPVEQIARDGQAAVAGAHQADHVGPQVGQVHGAERAGAQAANFQHAQGVQNFFHACLLVHVFDSCLRF